MTLSPPPFPLHGCLDCKNHPFLFHSHPLLCNTISTSPKTQILEAFSGASHSTDPPLNTTTEHPRSVHLFNLCPPLHSCYIFASVLPGSLFIGLFHLDYLPLAPTLRWTIVHIIHQLHSWL